MDNPFQLVVDANFEQFGVEAKYIPQYGEAFDICVIPRRSDEFIGLGETTVQAQGILFDVRTTELKDPGNGDEIIYKEESYFVQNTSQPDGDRLLWLLDTYQE